MKKGDKEPIDPKRKAFLSPVFLVDPMFTKDQRDEDIQVFRDNDFAGWNQPVKQSKWPIIHKEVQRLFKVGEDCSQTGIAHDVKFTEPEYKEMQLPGQYLNFWEPQYKEGAKKPKA